MFDRRCAALVVLALAAVVGLSAPGFSSAAYTSSSSSSATVRAAVDWTPPSVAMVTPPSPATGTVVLTANASDGETGVGSVTIEHRLVGASTWTTVCTATAAPYSCSWNTVQLSDGSYDIRARAVDRAGYATTSAAVRVAVANSASVVLTEPAPVVRGSVPLSATLQNPAGLAYTVRIESSTAGTNTWKSICTGLSSPYSCSWVTTGYANGDYDLRAVATSGTSTLTSAVVTDVTVDNLAPTVSMTDPGTPLRGTRTFAATASDAHSGVDQVTMEYALSGSSTWKPLCTVVDAPYSCRFDTSTIPDGTYSFRATATDVAGNSRTSTTVANRVVDNTVSAVSMEDPGPILSGIASLTASASSTAGVASVRVQYATTGGSTWTDVCTDTSSPWSCAWDTTKVADAAYDFRAILVDGRGATTTSSVLTGTRVDNTPLRGADVQATNGGATAGRLEAGDELTFTWSSQLNLASVTSGWTGAAQTISVDVRDRTMSFSRTGGALNLGSVNLKQNYAKAGKTVSFDATMTAGTVVVDGITRTTVTVRLGTLRVGGSGLLTTATQSTALVWTPSGAVTDLNGRACSTAAVTEAGILDRDF